MDGVRCGDTKETTCSLWCQDLHVRGRQPRNRDETELVDCMQRDTFRACSLHTFHTASLHKLYF